MKKSNIYHRYLNLDFFHIKPKLFETTSDSFIHFIDKDVIDPKFQNFVNNLNLKISNVIEGFYTPSMGGTIPLHTDTFYRPYEKDLCKLNFTWGPKTSVTRWYEVKDEKFLIEVFDDVNKDILENIKPDIEIKGNYTANYENCDLVYEAVIDKPSLLNVSQLHTTFNPGKEDRWTLSFTLLDQNKKILTFDEALEIFKNYIIDV